MLYPIDFNHQHRYSRGYFFDEGLIVVVNKFAVCYTVGYSRSSVEKGA